MSFCHSSQTHPFCNLFQTTPYSKKLLRSVLPSLCPMSFKLSKPSFFNICPRIASCFFLILCKNVPVVSIFLRCIFIRSTAFSAFIYRNTSLLIPIFSSSVSRCINRKSISMVSYGFISGIHTHEKKFYKIVSLRVHIYTITAISDVIRPAAFISKQISIPKRLAYTFTVSQVIPTEASDRFSNQC